MLNNIPARIIESTNIPTFANCEYGYKHNYKTLLCSKLPGSFRTVKIGYQIPMIPHLIILLNKLYLNIAKSLHNHPKLYVEVKRHNQVKYYEIIE